MKNVQSLNKFKNYELKKDSIKAIIGGTIICTTTRNGTYTDVFNDSSKGKTPSGTGWPKEDLVSAC